MKELFIKYIKGECSHEEVDQIVAYLKKSEDLSEVPTFNDISEILERYPEMDENASDYIYNSILEINKVKRLPIKRKFQIWKYAAAAVIIGILATTYLFKVDNSKNPPEIVPVIVNNEIEVGTDKASLTLEDGSVVLLDEGNTYQTSNATSNGEKIIYKNRKTSSKDIVYNYLTIPRGGQFLIKLADGTQVWLNSESQLKYPTSFVDGETRQVELVYGEAYFDVSPSTEHDGSRFKVLNKSQEIEVLGTEFNLKAYKDDNNVFTTLVEGKVGLSSALSHSILKPKQQAIVNVYDKKTKIIKVDLYHEISWKDGVFSFRKKPLGEIMKVLSRWYDLDVQFTSPELKNKGFNGVLGKDQEIEEILDIIKSFGVISDYEINNKTVILK